MIAITTKFLGPTNHRPARVAATTANGHRVVLSWNHALSSKENHKAAAHELAGRQHWIGTWTGGGTREGWAYVCVSVGVLNTSSPEWGDKGATFHVARPEGQ